MYFCYLMNQLADKHLCNYGQLSAKLFKNFILIPHLLSVDYFNEKNTFHPKSFKFFPFLIQNLYETLLTEDISRRFRRHIIVAEIQFSQMSYCLHFWQFVDLIIAFNFNKVVHILRTCKFGMSA